MHEDTHEDEPLDIAPEGDAQEATPPAARIVAAAALRLAEKAGQVSQALNRSVGRLRRLADAMEVDAIVLLGIEVEMYSVADRKEGLDDG